MWGIIRLPDVIEHARHATSNQPILVIPPFPAPNAWTFLLRSALERCGFKTDIWDLPVKFRFIRLNSGFDFERDIPKAIAKLKSMYEASGNQKITIVGHSLGAAEALVFATHPETRNYIAGIVMFGGPLTFDPKTVNPIISGLYEWINGSLTQHSTNVIGLLEENGLRMPAISWRSKGDGFI
jgi:pimeloyl-ACP methyl ester carboxylesterase